MTDALNCIGNRDPVPDEPTSTRKLPRGLGPARVDIIIVGRVNSTTLAMKATASIPNVMTVSVDPIATGLVASLARPGGNVTGLAVDTGSRFWVSGLTF